MRSQIKRGNHVVDRPRNESPLNKVEDVLVEKFYSKGRYEPALDLSRRVGFGRHVGQRDQNQSGIDRFQEERLLYEDINNLEDTSDPDKLSNKRWSKLLKTKNERFRTKRGVKFVNECAAWCKFNYFSKMYELL